MKTVIPRRNCRSFSGLIDLLAGNRATLALLALLAAGITAYYQTAWENRLSLVALPALLLILNFLLALAIRGILRNNWPLMVFHFALVALVLLAFAGQLSYFRATLELATGESFDGRLENVRQGPLHRFGLDDASFTNRGFSINYHEGIKRDRTRNRVGVLDQHGREQVIEIGDHEPLVLGHYRFYTSHNKGYAPIFEWLPEGSSESIVGSIHLPAYPVHEFRQALEWEIPGSGETLWTMLLIDDDVLPEDRAFEFTIPERHRLVVRRGEERHELRPGDELSLSRGVLVYRELSSWMGYKVDYDWTRPWLLASALVGLAALFLHYLFKFDLLSRRSFASRGVYRRQVSGS